MSMRVADSQTYLNDAERGGCWRRKSGLEQKLILCSGLLGVVCLGLIIGLIVAVNQHKDSTDQTVTTLTPSPQPDTPTSPNTNTPTNPNTNTPTNPNTNTPTNPNTNTPTNPNTNTPTTPNPDSTTTKYEVCQSEICSQTANYYTRSMNESVDPCNNFYDFVCGGWEGAHDVPEDKGRWGVFDVLRVDLAAVCIDQLDEIVVEDQPKAAIDNARIFYKGCVETEGNTEDLAVEYLKKVLVAVSGTPDIMGRTGSMSWNQILAKMANSFGLSYVISVGVGANIMNTRENVIYIDQQNSFPVGRLTLLNGTGAPDADDNKIAAYSQYIAKTICLFNKDYCKDSVEELPSAQQLAIEDIIDFEKALAKITRSPVERRNATTWYNNMTVGELQNEVNYIEWVQFLNEVLSNSGEMVNSNTTVIVREPTYLKDLNNIIIDSPETVENYIRIRLVQALGPYLSPGFRDMEFEFEKVVSGINKQVNITQKCFDLVNGHFAHAVGRLYVEAIGFTEEAKADMESMVGHLADAFRTLVDNNDWMDEPTKQAAKEKLKVMDSKIGFPDWAQDNATLDNYYALPTGSLSKTNFFSNIDTMMQFSVVKSFNKLSKQNNRTDDWVSPASIVNAFYSPNANGITFPAGILQVPFYKEKRLRSLNYGGIGYVIGHEITHGFDDQGSQYDPNGNFENWWSESTLTEFNKRKQCFIDQYSDIVDKMTGLNLKGDQVIGENIADNGGIRESYHAYMNSDRQEIRLPGMEHITDEQLFFIAAGSVWCTEFRKESLEQQILYGVHSPGRYRATIPLRNMEQFASAFNCPDGSYMKPEKKDQCVIW